MKKKILFAILSILLATLAYFTYVFAEYFYRQNENKKMVQYCSQNDTKECYDRMFELMLPELLLYDAFIDNKPVELIKIDEEQSRIDSYYSLKNANAMLGYGVYFTTNYEENYSELFDKNSYTFDCGVHSYKPNHEKCYFYSECIASDKFLIFDHMFTKQMQVSSGSVHTLNDKLLELNLKGKNVFVKMDVAEADVVAIPELVKNSDSIIGVNLALYLSSPSAIIERIPVIQELNKDFILIARNLPYRHTNADYEIINSKYYRYIQDARYMYLSYINKKFVQKYFVSLNQNTGKYSWKGNVINLSNPNIVPVNDISLVVPITKKLGITFDVDGK